MVLPICLSSEKIIRGIFRKDEVGGAMDEKVLYSNAMVLKIWTDRLFFVIIFNIVFENITGLEIFSENMVLSTLSQAGSLFFTILYGICLIAMSKVCKKYLYAALPMIALQIWETIIFLFPLDESIKVFVIRTIIQMLILFVSIFFELMAYSETVSPYNLMMAGDWKRLLKWYGVVFIALAVICFGILTGGFTVFVLQLYVVAMLILSIIKIRYVRQTYNIYLNYLKIGGMF